MKGGKPRRVRRRWWQVCLRAGLLLALLLAAAYMSFPWWAPRQLLARKAQEMLSRRLGAPVEIGKMELSWGGGLVLEDLRLGSDQEFGGGEMVHLRRLQCDLSPLHYLWTGQIEWAQLDSARIHAVVSPEGKLNLASLQRLTTGRDKIPHRLSVRSASIELELPRHDRLLRLNVSDLEYLSGRLEHVGRLTMSAGLIQQGGEAPVTLLASSSEQGPVVAGCSFRFSGIDLQQLNLPLLLGLSLKQFRGTGSGQLDCQLDQTGLVDNFSLALWVKDLDVQPVMGPSLPVVDLAEISLQASYDPLAETGGASSLNVTGFRVRVPGVDLAGRGRMSLARLLGGGWEAVTNLDVSGQVNPRAVAALLSGGPAPLPGGLDVDGSVLVGLTLRGDEKQSSMALTADATAAAISLSGRTLKPARRPLTVNFSGNLEKLTWQFSADKAQLQLGENRFASAGAMQNIRSVLGAWDKAGRTGGFRWVMRTLASLDWHGSWEINELDSLGDLLGPAMPKDVRLAGKCEGQWAIQQAGGLAVSAQFSLPPGTQLEWGNQFQKPVELPMEVQLSGQVSPDVLSLSQGRLRLLVGQAAASLEDVCIAFTEDASSAQAMPLLLPILSLPTVATGSGVFRLADLRTLSRCLPGLAKLEGKLTGTVTGRFDALAGAGARRLHLQIAASQSGLDLGPFFVKSPGEPAAIEMDLLADQKMEAQRRNRLSLEARLGSCTMHAALLYPSAGLADGFDFRGELSVADAQRFIRQAPMLEQALAGWEPRGSLDTEVQLQRNGQDYEGNLVCQADRLTFRRPGIGGAKASGVPLRLRLCGQATEKSARLSELAVCLGNSNFRAQGQVQLRPFQPLPAGRYWPPPGVAGADLEFISRVVLAPEATLPAMFPELGLQILRSGLEGTIGVRGRLSGSANGLDVEIAADGTDLAVSIPDAYRKPAGAKALADISMYFPPDLAQFSCRGFSLRTDAFEISGDARWPFLKVSPAEARLAVSVADARALCRYFPAIALYSPSGKLLLDTQYQRSGRQAGRLLYATLTASDLGLQLAGKSVSLNGTVTAGDVGLADDIGDCTIGRLATGLSDRTGGGAGAEAGALEFAVGQTHGYILADLPRTCGTLVGKVDMRMGLLDGVELDQWLSQLKEPGLGQKTTSAPARQTPPGLTAQRLAVLASQAASGIQYVRSHQAGMDLQLSLSIDRLRSLDPSTQTMFEPQAMLLKAQARDGQYNVAYACGLNGGTLERTYVADLRQDNPRVQTRTQLRQAMMDKNLQLQLNQDFPGNNVSGKLSRQEELSFGLQDVAMNLLDSRYRPVPVGIARTITEDGVLIGRGAPKWMSNVFHGLDLMTYHYNTMTGTAQFNPDGSASNEMIFDGSSYNIYIRGSTDAKRIGRYEIGVLLGAARAPVLNFQARIEDGRFYDEEVSYPFPTETAYKFFLRNIAEGLHLGTERPSDKPIPPIKTASMPAN